MKDGWYLSMNCFLCSRMGEVLTEMLIDWRSYVNLDSRSMRCTMNSARLSLNLTLDLLSLSGEISCCESAPGD